MAWSQVSRIYYIIRTNSLGYVNSSALDAGVGLLSSPSAFRNSFKVDEWLERGAKQTFAIPRANLPGSVPKTFQEKAHSVSAGVTNPCRSRL
jgi:hypothetical protein